MFRAFLPSLILLIACLTLSAEPPKVDKMPKEGYFPTTVGTKWVHKMSVVGSPEQVQTTEIAKVTEDKGKTLVTIERINSKTGKRSESQVMEITDKGLFRISLNGKPLAEPQPLLKYPVTVGDKWEFEASFKFKGQRVMYTREVVGFEKVDFQKGKVDAIKLTEKATLDDKPPKATQESEYRPGRTTPTYWYVPNVGEVRWEMPGNQRTLEDYTEGKK